MSAGNIDKPANAIPGKANAVLQLRFVVGTKYLAVIDGVRDYLHKNVKYRGIRYLGEADGGGAYRGERAGRHEWR